MKTVNWKHVNGSPYEWMFGFNEIMNETTLPLFEGETLLILSDYSGLHKQSRYNTITLLIIDLIKCSKWECCRENIRRLIISDGRRISYKGLNDRLQRNALPIFLSAAGTIDGLILSVVLDKKIKGLITARKTLNMVQKGIGLKAKWNIYEFEKMARVAYFVSVLTGGLVRPKQNIIWISDDDDIFVNEDKKKDTARILSGYTSSFIRHELGNLYVGTTDLDIGDRLEEDFVAIPDLVGGAVTDYVNTLSKTNGWPLGDWRAPKDIKPKCAYIMNWLVDLNKNLKYGIIVFEKDAQGRLLVFPLEFD